MRRMALRGSASLALLMMLWGAPVIAEVSSQNQAAARALFEQARELAGKKKYAEACPKFEESQRLDPGMGTLFNLADCYEQIGKTASAWSMFLDVASQAAAAKRSDRESAARDRAATLKPRLSNLVISLAPGADLAGLEIKRGNTVVGKATWGSPVPVDPGKHEVTASAAGHKTWTGSVEIPNKPGDTILTIPALEADATAAPSSSATVSAASDSTPAPEGKSNRRLIGLVVGGVGVVGFGVGTLLAFQAKSKFNDSSSHCTGNLCDQEGADLRHDAVKGGNVATVVGGIGLAAIAAGVVLYVTAPSNKSSTSTAYYSPTLGVGPGSVLLSGRF